MQNPEVFPFLLKPMAGRDAGPGLTCKS